MHRLLLTSLRAQCMSAWDTHHIMLRHAEGPPPDNGDACMHAGELAALVHGASSVSHEGSTSHHCIMAFG